MSHSMHAFAAGDSSSESDSDQDDFLQPSADPNADEFADFNPRKRRRTGRDAKESAALGIFGSESEDDGTGKRWKSKRLRGKGMSFVKSGDQRKNEDNDADNDDDEEPEDGKFEEPEEDDIEDEDEDEDEDGDTEMRGLGYRKEAAGSQLGLGAQGARPGLGGGLGFQSPAVRKMGFGNRPAAASPLGLGFVPSSAAVPILQKTEDDEPVRRSALPSAFSTPTAVKAGRGNTPRNGTPINAGSFAARMMAKMGYKEGQGLGKEGQGRSGVIEVQLRPQGVGLGAVKEKSKQEREEEKRQAKIRGEVLEDSEEEERKRRRKPKTSGTDSGTSTPKRRQKPKYQSLPELQRAAPGLKIPDAFTPILDMTGPGQKYLTTGSGFGTPTGTSATESTEVVEARKLARRAQNDLSYFVEEWKNLEERKAWIEMEIMQQQQAVDEQKSASEQLISAAGIVEDLAEAVRDGQWDPVIEALRGVESLGVAGNDELASIAVAAINPFFRQATEGWQPLGDPKLSAVASGGFAPALHSIRELLGTAPISAPGALAVHDLSISKSNAGRAHKTTPFESMMYTVWLPKVRSAITNSWDVHDPAPLQTLLEAWEDFMPPFIRSQILDQLVVRKLDEAVASWNPKKRRSSSLPHLWLFPWLQYLPTHHADPKSATGLVSDVKRKFRVLIDAWDFRRGVIPGLEQWKFVLGSGTTSDQWTPLLLNHILPHLAKFLHNNFQVAPQDQEPYMSTLCSTLEWESVLGPRILGQLLVDELFPMWHDVLHQWLTLDGVNYLEIRDWFDYWRSIIPSEISDVPAVKAEWQKGNALINQALDLGPEAKTALPAPTKSNRQTSTISVAKETPPVAAPKAAPEQEEVTFRHQVEDWCMEHELQFIPEKSTLEANGPVYRVTAAPVGKGGVLIYLSADEIYAMIKRGSWTRMGKEMDALFELAHR
jgi:tuftelin-interacting protein 11